MKTSRNFADAGEVIFAWKLCEPSTVCISFVGLVIGCEMFLLEVSAFPKRDRAVRAADVPDVFPSSYVPAETLPAIYKMERLIAAILPDHFPNCIFIVHSCEYHPVDFRDLIAVRRE